MTIHENLTQFAGKPVADFTGPGSLADFAAVAPRVRCDYNDKGDLAGRLNTLLAEPGAGNITALVLGLWLVDGEGYENVTQAPPEPEPEPEPPAPPRAQGNAFSSWIGKLLGNRPPAAPSNPPAPRRTAAAPVSVPVTPDRTLAVLVAHKDRLPRLKSLFIGDIISEENEMSWIHQGNLSVLWEAFPQLEELGARGVNDMDLGQIRHPALKRLVIETGGMPAELARQALAAEAPLEHLELWLGTEDYGGSTTLDDLEPLFQGALFPHLNSLGLCNSEIADDLAERLATSPLLPRLRRLDMSRGTLSDRGARALIASGHLAGLERLEISFHYVSPEVVEDLRRATPVLVADDAQEPDDWGDGEHHYYVAVSE